MHYLKPYKIRQSLDLFYFMITYHIYRKCVVFYWMYLLRNIVVDNFETGELLHRRMSKSLLVIEGSLGKSS